LEVINNRIVNERNSLLKS